ncbi:signal peptidase II [Mycolicibacterium phocaicum]|uniref:Lipoprotein signal peptidase n=1 Tax=Mycolicibacterium phocaicum TaxID=319706 RepID=A0A7I7ZI05_9MYCO|nr:signal peptidase II [Mycolicibacterium phocaicum]BBZ53878.1 lipoprotein signal peptidase [Mycolicibacterium phocaicum]
MTDESTEPEATSGTGPETAESAESPVTAPPQGQPVPRRLRLLLMVAALVLGLDVLTKVLAVKLLVPGQPVEIIGDTITWTLVRNSGAAFSMATGYTWVLTLIATGVVLGIIWMGRRLVSLWWALGLGMILGGAVGNLMDRFFRSPGPLRGHVVDFLSVGWWPVFNVADSAVVCGAVLLVGLSMFGIDFDTEGKQPQADDPAESTDTQQDSSASPAPAAAAADEAETGR